ncbi:MAG: NAD-dependent epimerase/dehydratase family protein [Nitrospinae bacterium]|nr:NAD-dependent epimerase/dehydratase family protein [Nitrospinota bacterium]
MKKILITGVAGFVGSNLCKKLLSERYQVIGLDNLSQGSLRNMEPFKNNPSFEFVEGDVRDEALVTRLVERADVVAHLAAFKIPRYGNAMDTLKINTRGTRNIFNAGSRYRRKIVFTSTSDVYGKNPDLPFSEESDLLLGETSIKRWSYAVSKLYDEHLAYAHLEERQTPIAIIRYFGGYGPNQNLTWWGGPQSVFIEKAIKNEPLTIHGDGNQRRSFTYVDDMVNGTFLVIDKDGSAGEIWNIGNDREITIKALGKMIWNLVRPDTEPKMELISYKSFSGHYEDVMRRIPDLAKSKQRLGFNPVVPLEQGLPITIQWQKQFYPETML